MPRAYQMREAITVSLPDMPWVQVEFESSNHRFIVASTDPHYITVYYLYSETYHANGRPAPDGGWEWLDAPWREFPTATQLGVNLIRELCMQEALEVASMVRARERIKALKERLPV